jgi:hypothetical protein
MNSERNYKTLTTKIEFKHSHTKKHRVYEIKEKEAEKEIMVMKHVIDPPSGWKYGFPMVYDEKTDGDIFAFLRSKGYPQAEIDSYGNAFYIRHMDINVDE